jgi:excisionase family DNA binding protein
MFLQVPRPVSPGGSDWLTLQEASRRLDVHPATLRQWADTGRLRAFRTPGGHRRFSAEDVGALLAAQSNAHPPELDLLLDAALGRARRELSGGRLSGESWHRLLDPGTRERYRQLGRGVLGLLVRALAPGADTAAVLAEAGQAGAEQGRLAAEAGLTLVETVRAHTCFRDMLVESALQMKAMRDHGRTTPDPDPAGSYRPVGAFLDEVLVACLAAFTEAGS